jgi:hypothetical protein
MGNFVTTTNPSTPVQNTNFTLTITDAFVEDSGMFQAIYEPYVLTLASTYEFTDYTIVDGNTLRFNDVNVPVSGTLAMEVHDGFAAAYSGNSNNTWTDTINLDPICYVAGTKITCQDGDVNVEDLQPGMMVKVLDAEGRPGYRAVVGSMSSVMYCSKSHNYSKVYCLPKGALGENLPFQDLFVSGAHSYLVKDIGDEGLKAKMAGFFGADRATLGGGLYKLVVSYSPQWHVAEGIAQAQLHHFALEHENELDHYAILANGVWSESMNLNNLRMRQ